MSNLEQIYNRAKCPETYARGYLDYLSILLKKLDTKKIALVMSLMDEARLRGAQIFFLGNGGSASTSSHFANDLSIGARRNAPYFRAISLCDNTAIITAIANDKSYEEIFIEQLKVNLKPNDLVIGISASGNSENVVRGIGYAKKMGCITVGLVGFDGGILKSACDVAIHIETESGEYGPVEDVHMILDHLVSSYFNISELPQIDDPPSCQ